MLKATNGQGLGTRVHNLVIELSLSEPHTSRITCVYVCMFVFFGLLVTESKDGPWTGQFDDQSQDHTHPDLVAITGFCYSVHIYS